VEELVRYMSAKTRLPASVTERVFERMTTGEQEDVYEEGETS
jgi:hypothetical protein